MLVTGPLATAPSCSNPRWWTGTSPSRSGQLRGGQGTRTGVAAVRETVWIAKHPYSPASPCVGATPEPNNLGMGCPGYPPRSFDPGGNRGLKPEDGLSLGPAPVGLHGAAGLSPRHSTHGAVCGRPSPNRPIVLHGAEPTRAMQAQELMSGQEWGICW